MFNLQVFQGLVVAEPRVWFHGPAKVASVTVGITRATGPRNRKWDWDYINVRAFGKLADIIERNCRKGLEAYVCGRNECDNYTGPNGEKWMISYCRASLIQIQWPGRKIDITGDVESAAELLTQVPEGYICVAADEPEIEPEATE